MTDAPSPRERLLPLFPLPLVLFPGVPLPLHIFEPRYRRMLADCLAGDREFGILFRPEDVPERELPSGYVGCVASIEHSDQLPDGRSNIIVTGATRFALRRFVESTTPYHVGAVTPYEDRRETFDDALASRLRALFERVGVAARTLADDTDPLPRLPDDAAQLSFTIASVLDLDGPTRQGLLESRSPNDRLAELERILGEAATPIEERAAVHTRAKSNGRGLTAS